MSHTGQGPANSVLQWDGARWVYTADPILTSVSLGAAPFATTGQVRGGAAFSVFGKDGTGVNDRSLFAWAADVITIGNANAGVVVAGSSGAGFDVNIAGSVRAQFRAGALNFLNAMAIVEFAGAISNPSVRHGDTSGAVTDFRVRAGGKVSAAGNGGALLLSGGRFTAPGIPGPTRIQLNQDNATFQTLAEVAEVATSRQVVALCRGADISTTQMPADTGNRVVYVANAQADPGAGNPVDGHLYYGTGGVAAWKTAAGNRVVWNCISDASASAGGGQAVPTNVAEYLRITFNGNIRLIPLFNQPA